ncbi:MAG: hypothetical protein ACTHMM_13540 [Agriterribacter sp.]
MKNFDTITAKTAPSTTPASTWMQDNIGIIGGKKLNEICILGSHDSGMYKRTKGGTVGAFDCNTLTQSHSILGQLNLGVRYFDIRPVIASGEYYTGHYSDTGTPLGWQGANGESIDDIISDLNTFNQNTRELIILNLSHAYNTDVGRDYRGFTQAEWDGLLEKLSTKVNHLFSIDGDLTNLITEQTINTFIGNGKPAVVFIIEPTTVELGKYCKKGFYLYQSCNAYNSYSDTNDVDKMIADQIAKMKAQSNSYFLLSWTLTQDATQAATCEVPIVGGASIKDLAHEANNALDRLIPFVTPVNKPRIIYIDAVEDTHPLDLVLYLNLSHSIPGATYETGQSTQDSPSLTPFTGKVYCAFKSNDSSNRVLIISSENGIHWSGTSETGQSTGAAPALVVFNNKLCYAFKCNYARNLLLTMSSQDGIHWSGASETGQSTGMAPAVAVFSNKLFCAFKCNDSRNLMLTMSSEDGVHWSGALETGQSTGAAPAVTVLNNMLYCTFKCNDPRNLLLGTVLL